MSDNVYESSIYTLGVLFTEIHECHSFVQC